MLENNFNWKDKTIIVVDKHEINYFLIGQVLEKTEAKIIWEPNCEKAVDLCKINQSIDVVLIDIEYKNMNGLEAIRQILDLNNGLTIIGIIDRDYMTNYNDKEFLKFISKPLSLTEFLSTIKALFLNK